MVVFLVGAVVAVVAAGRSTWSPCGLSMLSTITPFGERARRHRYGVTAGWFLLGSLAGGATLGGAAAALAALVAAMGVAGTGVAGTGVAGTGVAGTGVAGAAGSGRPVLLGVAAAAALAGALVDAGAFGAVLPLIRRQVDDRWLARYRPWVYGVGFGWQIGVGFATYLMTAGVILVAVLGVLSGSVLVAFGLGVVFGAARGSTVFLTARAVTPASLRALHGRLERFGPAVRRAAAGAQAGAAVGLALVAGGVVAGSGLAPAGLAAAIAAAAGVVAGVSSGAAAPAVGAG